MCPVLFRIGQLEIRTWGLFVLVSVVVGIYYVSKRVKSIGVNPEKIWDLGFWAALAGIIGSRIFYVLYHIPYFKEHPVEIIKFWEGGSVYFGGFLFGLAAGLVYLQKNKKSMPLLPILDFSGEALALGLFIGRWGCLFNGCCFGKETHMPWGIVFPPGSPAFDVMGSSRIHPSQLYESFANLVLFFVLLKLEQKKPFDGFIFLFYIFFASLIRFLVDITRYYEPGNVFILSVNQWISIAIMVVVVIVGLVLRKKSPVKTSN
ncbi:MAG TPA: prolipoprotein diacylglyceryl transferase [Candidatus Hydrothermia bacterium]|nr:prolipoprotein diacylglyceryl transferase [Candidatus Hydrothermia bacterium]MDD5572261.1 prolipoprotein diacylglyceryl transferase [Candidatus Hydrothermia bacterium]HOP32647.1 prolipoprotein diacylglyceryl transferase [Candidatus Hydrothermia bacterium]